MKDGKDNLSHKMDPEDDALNQLLGRAKTPTVNPYFSRRVLREVTALEENRGLTALWTQRWQRWLDFVPRLPRMTYSGGALAVAVVGAVSLALLPQLHQTAKRPAATPHPTAAAAAEVADAAIPAAQTGAAEEVTSQDVDVIADLDNLMALEENRIWTDDNSSL